MSYPNKLCFEYVGIIDIWNKKNIHNIRFIYLYIIFTNIRFINNIFDVNNVVFF